MECLIESVRRYPCLWDVNLHEYKLHDVKDAAWRQVVAECDNISDVKEARSMWKRLRDSHRQAISRNKSSTPRTKWKYVRHMEFLLASMKNGVARRQESSQHSELNEDSSEQELDSTPSTSKQANIIMSVLDNEKKAGRNKYKLKDDLARQLLNHTSADNSAMGHFFNSMLLTTLSLPERSQIKIQREIFNLVMEEKELSIDP